MSSLDPKGLLPCPFCGEQPKFKEREEDDNDRAPRPHMVYYIECESCEFRMDMWSNTWWSGSSPPPENDEQRAAKGKAIEAWNRRALPSPSSDITGLVVDLRSAARKAQALKDIAGLKGASLTTIRRLAETSERAATALSSLSAERDAAVKERDDARHEVWALGLTVGQVAKWPRIHFNRLFLEEWAIRTAKILLGWGDSEGAQSVLRVSSNHTQTNKRLSAEADAIASLRKEGK